MVKISDLRNTSVKEIELNNGIILKIKNRLSVNEQIGLGLADMQGLAQVELAKRTPEIAFKLISDRNITDDEDNKCEIDFEIFKSLPISFDDMNTIISSCDSLFPKNNAEKKNTDEN